MSVRTLLSSRISVVLLACPVALTAQVAAPDGTSIPPKQAHAVRITGAPPRLDGRLDDAAWRQARFFSDFVQKEPVEGAVPSESTLSPAARTRGTANCSRPGVGTCASTAKPPARPSRATAPACCT